MRVLLSVLLVLIFVPGWTGEERLARPANAAMELRTTPVLLDLADPARRRVGALTFLGGVEISGDDPAFGGFSALSVDGARFTLLGDGGTILRFGMGSDWRPRAGRFEPLPGGPGSGWEKRDRDSESLAVDPGTGRAWIGFENHDALWRYAPGFARAERGRAPTEMRNWPEGGGAEAMARLGDGRFVLIAESKRPSGGQRRARVGLIFPGDPTRPGAAAARFVYRAEPGYSPVDMAELPDGRVVVLERAFALPWRWSNRLALVEKGAIRPGAVVTGRTVARLAAPLVSDNFEAVAAAREDGATILWLLSDDNRFPLQRTLLLKFSLGA